MLNKVDRWAVVARLIEIMRDKDGWAGETHIQKTLFFLQGMTELPTSYEFVLYKHGPYSFDLHDDLGAMRANLVIDISPRSHYGPSFELGELGGHILDRSKQRVAKYEEHLRFMVDQVGTKDTRTLERYSTALFVKSLRSQADDSQLRDEIVGMKPHISPDDALEAVKAVDQIEAAAHEAGLIL